MGAAIQPEEGPDMIHNCNTMYRDEYDSTMQSDIIYSSASIGLYKTSWDIFVRMLLDGMSAIVYLLQFKPANFKAVIKAHKDFRRLRKKTGMTKLKNYLREIIAGDRDDIARVILCSDTECSNKGGKTFRIKGMWGKWIVIQSILKKEAIFAEIKNNIR